MEDAEGVARCMGVAGAGMVVVEGREGMRAVDHRNNGVKAGGGR